MRCVAYCTAEKYELRKILTFFREKGFTGLFYRNVLYVHDAYQRKEIFLFSIGSLVFWNFTSREEKQITKELANFIPNSLAVPEVDYFIFSYKPEIESQIHVHERFNADVIILEDKDPQIKLAISYGLAQSVKLESFEEKIQKTIQKNQSLPEELAEKGKISISRHAISRRMGEIFLERNSINLSSEYLDMPEYFWKYPRLEAYFVMTEKFLDMPKRVESLNKRLDILHELFNILTMQLQHRHSSILEMIIIILIGIEIILSFTSHLL